MLSWCCGGLASVIDVLFGAAGVWLRYTSAQEVFSRPDRSEV